MIDPAINNYVLVPLLIFVARICDVTIGTIRILTMSRGFKGITACLAFFELLVWLFAIQQIFANLNNFTCMIAYAGGFASGNYLGMFIEQRIALGAALIRVVTKMRADRLIAYLKEHDYGFTTVEAQGSQGDVHLLFLVVKRKDIDGVIKIINEFNPKAFYSIEDVRTIQEGCFPKSGHRLSRLRQFFKVGK